MDRDALAPDAGFYKENALVEDTRESSEGLLSGVSGLESQKATDQGRTEQQYFSDPVNSEERTTQAQGGSEHEHLHPPKSALEATCSQSTKSVDPAGPEGFSCIGALPDYYGGPHPSSRPSEAPNEGPRPRSKASQLSNVSLASSRRPTPWQEKGRDQGFHGWPLTNAISSMWRRLHSQSPA